MTANQVPAQAREVDARAREVHRGVHGERDRAGATRGVEHARAESGGRVQHELARLPRARVGEPGDQRRELGLGHRRAARARCARRARGWAAPAPTGSMAAARSRLGVGDRGDAGECVTGAGQGRGEHGADPSGADGADAEPAGALSAHRPGSPGVRRVRARVARACVARARRVARRRVAGPRVARRRVARTLGDRTPVVRRIARGALDGLVGEPLEERASPRRGRRRAAPR